MLFCVMVWCTITTNDDDDRINASMSLETLTSREWLLPRLASFLWPCWNIIVVMKIRVNVREVICLCRCFCWIGRIQDYENVPMKKKDRFFLFSSSILFLPPALGEELIQLFHGICTLIIPVSDTFICLPHLSTSGAEQIGWSAGVLYGTDKF